MEWGKSPKHQHSCWLHRKRKHTFHECGDGVKRNIKRHHRIEDIHTFFIMRQTLNPICMQIETRWQDCDIDHHSVKVWYTFKFASGLRVVKYTILTATKGGFSTSVGLRNL